MTLQDWANLGALAAAVFALIALIVSVCAISKSSEANGIAKEALRLEQERDKPKQKFFLEWSSEDSNHWMTLVVKNESPALKIAVRSCGFYVKGEDRYYNARPATISAALQIEPNLAGMLRFGCL